MPNCEECHSPAALLFKATSQHICLMCLGAKPIIKGCSIIIKNGTITLKTGNFFRVKQKGNRRKSFDKRKRMKLFELQDKKCYYCERTIIFRSWTIDHKIPLCRGGRNDKDNLVGACHSCNGSKSLLTEIEFKSTLNQKERKELVRAAHVELWAERAQNAKPPLANPIS